MEAVRGGEIMHIVLADNTLCYNGRTPYLHPLGGSQAAAVYFARGLVELGHRVTFFNNTLGEPMFYDGVDYRHISQMTIDSREMPDVDVVVSIRDPRVLLHWEGGGFKVVRMQDDLDQPMVQLFLLPRCRKVTDHIFTVSEWQKQRFCKVSSWPRSRATTVPNGFWQGNFSVDFPEKVGNRLVYCSTPFRGLARLLDIFPAIKAEVPDAELHVFSDMSVYQWQEEDDRESYGKIYDRMDGLGVVSHGSVGQVELAKELEKCKVLSYVNTFAETSCIAQMEAQAAGCVAVATSLGALPETMGPHGILVPGVPGEREHDNKFVEECVNLLKDHDKWKVHAIKAREWMWFNHSYKVVAQDWASAVKKLIANSGRKKCLI
jgi:glycosyltransferase involved in cell wall biosynthesis